MQWLTILCGPLLVLAMPGFDPTALLRNVLIPADAAINTVIYRLRASDSSFDYPLRFELRRPKTNVIEIETLNCTRFNSVCQANVVLKKRLEIGRYYDFEVRISNQRGESASLNCSFRATNATTAFEKVFPGAPTLLMVSESARRNTELGTVLAKGNPERAKPVLLELWGSTQFGLHQRLVTERDAEGTILLLNPLDYETKTVHHITILANDPWSEMQVDTRNIAGWPLLVAVLDEQDTPPIFKIAPPTTTLSPSLKPNDLILRVHAEDGDRGTPRDIRYSLLDNTPMSKFFTLSENSGELRLKRPLSDILSVSHSGQPILLTVVAEEVRSNPEEAPAQSSSVKLALIPPGITAGSPTFGAIEYNTLLDENSPTGTILDLPQAEIMTQPGDVITLELMNNNNTFDISPSVVEGYSTFQIRVHDPKLLDYEQRRSVQCFIVAKEIGQGNYTASAKLTVLLNDINDNPPQFTQDLFQGSVQESPKIGITVLRVEANDVDREPSNKIKYTKLMGDYSHYFNLDEETGIVTVANSALDAEITPQISLMVEAVDENGKGLTATSSIQINLIDINDNAPYFERPLYEFILNPERTDFTSPAIIKAIDDDLSSPNNEVYYELLDSVEELYLNEKTGELHITRTWTQSEVTVIRGRAWDGGIPRLYGETEIRIYPPDGQSKKMVYIVAGSNPDREKTARLIRTLTGGRVQIDRIRPYTGYEPGATDVTRINGNEGSEERSVVEATVTFSKDAVVDVNKIQQILDRDASVSNKEVTNISKQKEIVKGESGSLLWLLILLIILAIIAAIILILCCICERCPLYIPPKRRKIISAEVQKLVTKGVGTGRETKSVQVAEWFGRKEAWTPEHVMTDMEAESLRRHEMDRGSERDLKRTIQRQQQVQREASRDQLYIREGNADILRLVTRGGGVEQQHHQQQQQQIPVTLIADPAYMADSGKDILMRRFIDQQQAEAARSQVLLPNAVNRLQTEHELLEASLRQQNALLRQILLERERDLRFETQSLPAGTQTDHDAGTQTEPQYLRPPRRRVRSDNDASDNSDEEIRIIKARVKRRDSRRSYIKRKIKTPIQEESEIEVIEKPQTIRIIKAKPKERKIKHTRTSEMRQKRASREARSRVSKSALRREVLREISASLEPSGNSSEYEEYEIVEKAYSEKQADNEGFSDDSLDVDEISPRSEKTTDSGKQKYHSESDLRHVGTTTNSSQVRTRRASSTSLNKETKSQVATNKPEIKSKSKSTERTSRYMEWYNKKDGKDPKKKVVKKKVDKDAKDKLKEDSTNQKQVKEGLRTLSTSRLMKDTESSARKKVEPKKSTVGPDHPLLQHSEYRYEAPYMQIQTQPVTEPLNQEKVQSQNLVQPQPQKKADEKEDGDSGISLVKPPMAQKQSVFTIAYNDMHTKQLRPESTSPPL